MYQQSWLNITDSLPDGCVEGASDGRIEGLLLGVAVDGQGAVFKEAEVSLILSNIKIFLT